MTFSNERRPYGRVRPSVVLVLALAAGLVATVLLWSRNGGLRRDRTEPLSVDAPDSSAAPVEPPPDAPAAASSSAAPTVEAATPRLKAKLRFTVAVAPLILVTTDRAATLASESIYAAFLDELRS